MNVTLHVWRQKNATSEGKIVQYAANDISEEMSFLEMLDVVNEELILRGDDPIAFDHDCREGICGTCGLMINGIAHGPQRATTACQLHMRHFRDGDTIYIEPWRAQAFPIIKDLVVDRSAFDRIVQAGGYISVATGTAPEANSTPVPKRMPTFRWMRRRVSPAARVWRLARTHRPCYSRPLKPRISISCRRASQSA